MLESRKQKVTKTILNPPQIPYVKSKWDRNDFECISDVMKEDDYDYDLLKDCVEDIF